MKKDKNTLVLFILACYASFGKNVPIFITLLTLTINILPVNNLT